MKILFLVGLFFPSIFGAYYEPSEHEVFLLFSQAKNLYLSRQFHRDKTLRYKFNVANKKLTKYLKTSFEKDLAGLLNIIKQGRNKQVTYFVFRKLLSSLALCINGLNIWKETLDRGINSSISFFKRSKTLMYIFCRGNPSIAKEIVPLFLLIQRQHLCHLKEDQVKLKKVTRWIFFYEEIVRNFEPVDLNVLLNLYKELSSLAKIHKGVIPQEGDEEFKVKSLLHRFNILSNQYYNDSWEQLDNYLFTSLPQGFLYLLIGNLSKDLVFRYLNDEKNWNLQNYILLKDDFKIIIEVYKEEIGTGVLFMDFEFIDFPDFVGFLRKFISKDSPYPLRKKEQWLIKMIFFIIPYFKPEEGRFLNYLFDPAQNYYL
jgi:hypothetical protein